MKKLFGLMVLVLSVLFVSGCGSVMPGLFYPKLETNDLMMNYHKSTMNCNIYYDADGKRLVLPSVSNEIVVSNCTDNKLVIEGNGFILDPGLKANGNWNFYGQVYSRTAMTLVIKVVDPKTNTVMEIFSKKINLEKQGKTLYSFLIRKDDDGGFDCTDQFSRNVYYTSYGGGVAVSSNNHRRGWSIFGGNDHHDRGHDNNRREHHR